MVLQIYRTEQLCSKLYYDVEKYFLYHYTFMVKINNFHIKYCICCLIEYLFSIKMFKLTVYIVVLGEKFCLNFAAFAINKFVNTNLTFFNHRSLNLFVQQCRFITRFTIRFSKIMSTEKLFDLLSNIKLLKFACIMYITFSDSNFRF